MERTKEVVVIDASVAVKWFVQEEFTDKALALAEDYRDRRVDLRSTQLMPFEVLNALRYNPEMGKKEVEKAGEALARLKISLYPVLGELSPLCLKAAMDHGLTVYDASYISLGRLLGCPVYTADVKLMDKTREVGSLHHISEYARH